jgi:hypothetical protein
MNILHLATQYGDLEIREVELSTITDAELQKWEFGISREELQRCFAQGVALMQGHTPGERLRPCASQRLDRSWQVRLVRYSPHDDPLMHDHHRGRAN